MSKYFKYAIGEILLVVIGILIALQINNWNIDSQNAQLTEKYLEQLEKDIAEDKVRLNKFIERAEDYTAKVDSLLTSRNQQLSKSDLDHIGIWRQTFFSNEGTLDEIISNGHLKLLPDSIKQAVLKQRTFFKAINKIDAANTERVNTQLLKLNDFYEVQTTQRMGGFRVTEYPHVNAPQALLVYRNTINTNYDWMNVQRIFYKELMDDYQNTITIIQKELGS